MSSPAAYTARSRTSGENLFDFVMAQSSQSIEPPQNPGRFITAFCKRKARTVGHSSSGTESGQPARTEGVTGADFKTA